MGLKDCQQLDYTQQISYILPTLAEDNLASKQY